MNSQNKIVISLLILLLIVGGLILYKKYQSQGNVPEKKEVVSKNNEEYNPIIDPANFISQIDNKYYPLKPGTVYVYEGKEKDVVTKITTTVTDQTKIILGVKTIVIKDTVLVNNNLEEETFDWYAQDKKGNVWYFGEDAKTYENGKVTGTTGSWEAGVNGAKPGIVMKNNPPQGDSYRQEYLKGQAEDMSQIISTNESVNVPAGSYNGCIKTKDWSDLEADTIENKIFCPNIGNVQTITVMGGTDYNNLVSIKTQ
jgi:hypothetical protein